MRILIADDHEVVRHGVRTLLATRPEWEICGEAVTGREAVAKCHDLKPDVVVLDMSMPELNGIEATRQILTAVPNAQVLILTIHQSEQAVRDILSSGARGYVLKSDAGRDLVDAVEALAQRKIFFTPKIDEILLESYRQGSNQDRAPLPHETLTSREREVLQLLAEGKSNKEVATLLGLGVTTIETHRTKIMHKLHAHSIAELVHYAIRNQIVEA